MIHLDLDKVQPSCGCINHSPEHAGENQRNDAFDGL